MATEPAGAGAAALTEGERRTLEALLERMFPTDERGPGALEADTEVIMTAIARLLPEQYRGEYGRAVVMGQ